MFLVLFCFLFPQSLHDFFQNAYCANASHTHIHIFTWRVPMFLSCRPQSLANGQSLISKRCDYVACEAIGTACFHTVLIRCFIQMLYLSLSDASFSCKLLCFASKFWCCRIFLKILTARLNSMLASSVRPDGLCRPLWRSVSRAFSHPLPSAPFLHFFLFPDVREYVTCTQDAMIYICMYVYINIKSYTQYTYVRQYIACTQDATLDISIWWHLWVHCS